MMLLIQVIAIVLATIFRTHQANNVIYIPFSSSLVLPISKHADAAKPLYSTRSYFNNSVFNQQNLLIDLDAPFIWHNCVPHQDVTWHNCSLLTNRSMNSDYKDYELNPFNIVNPVTELCSQDLVPTYNEQLLFNYSNQGRNVMIDLFSTYATTACASPSTFDAFPSNIFGVLSLSSSLFALQAQLHYPIEKILGLCLPSTLSVPGVMFLGDGPYYPSPKFNIDLKRLLSYTPLLKQPNSFGYFISINSIVIKNRSMNLPASTVAKISTLDPYTILRSDIYNGVVRRFFKVTKRIVTANPMAPFGLCFNTFANNANDVGITVPVIDLVLEGGKKWSIYKANSIKQVTDDVACLAFVDGGAKSEHAIVIGTYQFEDNFLLFNLENSTFGFSSLLLRKKGSCSTSNFTLINTFIS
ncbi:chitinase CLP-like [Rutidosis leptorrhynchoides]|uniref:chitinase CLP-like n=1 Tax=Rutidosis leptorrhynchoides TaxID=125765 RepID=UPI003A992AE8